MFGMGIWELLVIVIVAIVIVPPRKWPTIAQQAGVLWVSVKNTLNALKKEIS